MSKDCKRSYEEVHKKLGEELEKAYLKRETPEEKIPEFDLSFLEEQPYEPTEENCWNFIFVGAQRGSSDKTYEEKRTCI